MPLPVQRRERIALACRAADVDRYTIELAHPHVIVLTVERASHATLVDVLQRACQVEDALRAAGFDAVSVASHGLDSLVRVDIGMSAL